MRRRPSLPGAARRLRATRQGTRILIAAVSLLGAGLATTATAAAEACLGSGTAGCPYAGAQQIGRRAEGVLRFPEAVAVDAQGNVYVADQLSYTVQKFTAEGALEAEWGSYGGGHGQFGPIGGIATDAAGDVYVVDSGHNRIEKFDPNGNFILSWGHHGSEPGQFSFGSSQNFTQPPGGGIAVAGPYVFVADSGNDRVERFNLQGGEPLAWGTRGSAPGQFSYPRGVAAREGEVLVSDDDNHRVEMFNSEGAFEAETGTYGSGPGQFGFPYGIALDAAGNAYVADDINHRVVRLTPQLAFAGAWGGFGSKPGQLAFPRALASDPAGDTYVADTANDRIEVFNPEGAYLRTIGYSGRGPGELTAPQGLAVDPTGRLLAADTDGARVELFAPGSDRFAGQWTVAGGRSNALGAPVGIGVDPGGSVFVADRAASRLVTFWGDGTYLSETGGPAALGGATLSGNASVAVSPGDRETFVADSGHNRILVYGPEGHLKAKWGANEGSGAGGTGQGDFEHPQAVAVDPAGNVLVADTGNNRIVKLSPSGAVLAEWGARGGADGYFRSPTGIGVDAAGKVYVADSENNRVQAFDDNGTFLAKWGNRGTGVGQFSQPTSLAVGCEGDVYVDDTNNNRIERFEPVARAGSGCLAATAWPPPLPVAPVLSVKLLHAAGVLARRALSMTVACKRGCKVLVMATLTPSAGRRRSAVSLPAAARGLPPALAGHLRLRVGGLALVRLRRELGAGRQLRARVTIVAQGPTGLRTTVHRTYFVAR